MTRFRVSIEKKLLALILLVGLAPACLSLALTAFGGSFLFSQAMRGQLENRARELANFLDTKLEEQEFAIRGALELEPSGWEAALRQTGLPGNVSSAALLIKDSESAPEAESNQSLEELLAPRDRWVYISPSGADARPDGLSGYLMGLARREIGPEGYWDTARFRTVTGGAGDPVFEPYLVQAYQTTDGSMAVFFTPPRSLLSGEPGKVADPQDISLYSTKGFLMREAPASAETLDALRQIADPGRELTGALELRSGSSRGAPWSLLAYSVGRRMALKKVEGVAGPPWAVVIQYEMEDFMGSYAAVRWTMALGTVMWAVALTWVSVWASRRITAPLVGLRRQAEAMAAGQLDARVSVETSDEVRDLATAFNQMADRLSESYERITRFNHELEKKVEERTRDLARANQQLMQAEKHAATGRVAANLAHEINNPLGIIKNYARMLKQTMEKYGGGRRQGDPNLEHLIIINEELDRIARIVRQLLDLHRPPDQTVKETDINALLDTILTLMEKGLEKERIAIHRSFAPGLPRMVLAPDLIHQVFLNLLRNAQDAMEAKGGELVVQTGLKYEATTGGERRLLCVSISDTGAGIPEEIMGRIFDPFFTTKPQDKGTGLGLSVSYGIVQKYGGWIDVTSRPGEGTTMMVCLPISQPRDEGELVAPATAAVDAATAAN